MNAPRKTSFGNKALRAIAAFGAILAIVMVSLAPGEEKPAPSPEPAPAPAPTEAKDKPASVDAKSTAPVSGREIFLREWLPKDGRSHGGDGLGPVFNDSSCVACHNQGGAGGGGPVDKNVDIISAFVTPQNLTLEPSGLARFFSMLAGQPVPTRQDSEKQLAARKELLAKQIKKELVSVHPGFATARSVVLHQSGNDAKYDAWRAKFLGNQFAFNTFDVNSMPAVATIATPVNVNQGGPFESIAVDAPVVAQAEIAIPQVVNSDSTAPRPAVSAAADLELQRARAAAQNGNDFSGMTISHGQVHTITSQRNPTALFGAGLIDSIPDDVLEAQARVKHNDRNITGRVSRMKDGKIGRFGWKSQKVTLYDFTITACGVELGLHVPDHPQSGQPLDPKYQPVGYDLDQREVDALVDHLRKLPAPSKSESALPQQKEYIEAGRAHFAKVGCAACHVEKLGTVEGIYSDLLLHDMGEETADTGGYGVFVPESPGTETGDAFPALADAFNPQQPTLVGFQVGGLVQPDEKTIGATRLEWRTPPLWGVRDSAPYMHDGRASTLENAIAIHGGEASSVARAYFGLSSTERQQLIAFMKTLVAPSEVAMVE